MKYRQFYCVIFLCLTASVLAETPLFEKPQSFKQHTLLAHQMVQALRAGNIEQMEEVCRQAVEIMPQDATWTYNLACALAYREDKQESLQMLERAIQLGFRNVEAIEADNDLKQLKAEPRFAELVALARELKDTPVPGVPVVVPPTVMMGLPVEINPSNTLWNMDLGCFQSFFRLLPPGGGDEERAAAYSGPAADLIKSWLSAGGAAGNRGDLYMNRDRGHSKINVADFPALTPVVYSAEGVAANADYNLPNTIFEYPLIGNSSTAMTQGPYWRSLPRMALSDQFSGILHCRLYLSNQMWVYPEHQDYDSELGDLFPMNAPFYTVVQGSSYSDKPFLQAFAAAMAAFTPETKQYLIGSKLMAPTLQMLLRYNSGSLKKPEDYLDGAAHPAVFDGKDLHITNLVQMAHELKPDDVPPVVTLQITREDQNISGVDYFDRMPEVLLNTPCSIGRVARGVGYERKMVVQAQAAVKGTAEYHWVLLQGDPQKVQIKRLNADGSRVEITLGWHGFYRPVNRDGSPRRLMSGRVDVGCFVKGKRYYSAPSIVSVYYPPAEERVYNEARRIISVDYRNPLQRYSDPALFVQKLWKDLYLYTAAGELKGWYRKLDDSTERFTYAGHRVLESDKLDRPVLACAVSYLPRQVGGDAALPVMTPVKLESRFSYKYKDEQDEIGEFAPVN
ncbi:MAG: tetratricopeptide repeat protein [Kiritimatiellae bacterium]|nr:tetratricopeptide repeat protein [Kiritimatiellia bacterium]